MYSIFHFFKSLSKRKQHFHKKLKLEDFPFDNKLLSSINIGQFPDMSIKLSPRNELFTGGELIELKDSKSYTVSSFNSTIPSGKKNIEKIFKGKKSIIKIKMQSAGDDVDSLKEREVFYLIRGIQKDKVKVVLIHGNFFETVSVSDLISNSFSQVLEERCKEIDLKLEDEIKKILVTTFSEQESFSKVRNVEKASVKLRFRIMTEIKTEGNILNSLKFPEISDNTINLIVPKHSEIDQELSLAKLKVVFTKDELPSIKVLNIKHPFNGYFTVFQISLL